MFKFLRICKGIVRKSNLGKSNINRTFLTESFECREAWNKRLDSPIIKKVNLDNFYYQLDSRFHQTGTASAIDIDIFVNSIKDESFLDEAEDIVHKFRLSTEASNVLPSTHHGFIRTYLTHGDAEELLRILNDRLNYGIFPDDYCSILMMDKFIEAKLFREAAKVATLHMLQEDFSNPLIRYLSLYSCLKYLLNPVEWEKPEPVEEANDDEEEVRVRVNFIRNPFFDDHFDLRNPDYLLGKTLIMAGSLDDSVGNTFQAIGYCLYKKFDLAKSHFENLLARKGKLFRDGVTLITDKLGKVSGSEGEQSNMEAEKVQSIGKLIEQMHSSGLLEKETLESVTEQRLKNLLSQTEEDIIQKQKELYEEWQNQREILLQKEQEEIERKKRLEEVERKKEELAKREEELFFFERENELELKIESKRVIYPRKWLGKKKKKRTDSTDYIPPEVERRNIA